VRSQSPREDSSSRDRAASLSASHVRTRSPRKYVHSGGERTSVGGIYVRIENRKPR
jgi:hypothetical protein